MKVSTKHEREWSGVLTSFQGGLDRSKPPFLMDGENLYDMTNFFYDPKTGYPTTRPPLKKYSASASGSGSPINGIFEMVIGGASTVLLTCEDGKIYYLDVNLDPQLIGSLTGSARPSFDQMNGKAVICSGGVLQTYNGTTLVSTTSPTMSYISSHAKKDIARIIGCGNSTFTDRVYLSGSNDPANWTFNASPESDAKYFDAGYKDGLDSFGLASYMGDVFVFKKVPARGRRATYRAIIIDTSANWSCRPLSSSHTSLSPHFIIEAGDVYFMDAEGPKRLSAVPSISEFPFAIEPYASNIAGELRTFLSTDGFSIYDQAFGIIMTKPAKNSELFYCMDLQGMRWNYFKFGVNIQSGCFINGKMIFGATDGFLYEYDMTGETNDEGLFYPSIETKWFDIDFMLRNQSKEKYLSIIGITAGSLSFMPKERGEAKYEFAVTKEFGEDWWSWPVVNSITPEQWTESLTKIKFDYLRDNNRVSADQLSFQITVTSGMCALGQLSARIAEVGRT